MKREIKFRAWIKQSERMINEVGVTPWHVTDLDRFHWNLDQIELMQFTGLKDKEEKEIYEGDIVTDGNTVFEIEWYKGRFDFKRISGCYQHPYFGDNCSRMKIIGNIYESPELITNP